MMNRLAITIFLLSAVLAIGQVGRYESIPVNFSVERTNGVTTYTNKQAITGRIVAWSLWSNLNTTGAISTASGMGLSGSPRSIVPATALSVTTRVTGVIASNVYASGDYIVGTAANASTSSVLEVRGQILVEK